MANAHLLEVGYTLRVENSELSSLTFCFQRLLPLESVETNIFPFPPEIFQLAVRN